MKSPYCDKCGIGHRLSPTITPGGEVVGWYCPVLRRVVEVTSTDWDGEDMLDSIRGFLYRRVDLSALARLPDIQKLALKMTHIFHRTPYARCRRVPFAWAYAVIFRVLSEMKAQQSA